MRKGMISFYTAVLLCTLLVVPAAQAKPIAQSDISASGEQTLGSMTIAAEGGLPEALPAIKYNGIVYFAFKNYAQVVTFNLATEAWGPMITLGTPVQAIVVGDFGIYTVEGLQVYHYNLDGSARTVAVSLSDTDRKYMFVYKDYVFIATNWNVQSYNRLTGVKISEENSSYSFSGMVIMPNIKKAFLTPSYDGDGILTFSVSDDGKVGSIWTNPVHGNNHGIFPFTTQNRLISGSGQIFDPTSMKVSTILDASIFDLAEYGENFIISNRGGLEAYSRNLCHLGEFIPSHIPEVIQVYGASLYYFFLSGDGWEAFKIPLNQLNPTSISPEPAEGQSLRADQVFMGRGNIAYIVDGPGLSIYRYSLGQRQYLQHIALKGDPESVAYADEIETLYVGYSSGEITQVRLNDSLIEQPFVTTFETNYLHLVGMGKYLLIGSYENALIYDVNGVQQSQVNLYGGALKTGYWDPNTKRLYFLSGLNYGNPSVHGYFTIDTDGKLVAGESKSNGWTGIGTPSLTAIPDKSLILYGDGQIYDGNTLLLTSSTISPFDDSVWVGNMLYLFRRTPQDARIEKLDMELNVIASFDLHSQPLALQVVPEGLVAITRQAGILGFSTLDLNLIGLSISNIHVISLPLVVNKGYSFVDNFSNPSTGWPVSESGSLHTTYQSGQYNMQSTTKGYTYIVRAPSCMVTSYRLDVDAHFTQSVGSSYGVAFGITGDYDRFYTFEVYPKERLYALFYMDGTGYKLLEYKQTTAVQPNSANNHLELVIQDDRIWASVNGNESASLWVYQNPMLDYLHMVGLVASDPIDGEGMEAVFDNFNLQYLGGAAYCRPSTITSQSVKPNDLGTKQLLQPSLPW